MRNARTFQDVLASVKAENSRRVIERAVVANAMAKAARSLTARNRAYQAKTRALEHGIRAFPDDYALASINNGGWILGLQYRRRCALHVRAADLSPATKAWISFERAKITEAAADRRCTSAASARDQARLARDAA